MEEQVNLTVEQSIDINVNDDITVHIYRSPQGSVLDTYSVADGSHISTETIWEDEYKDKADIDPEDEDERVSLFVDVLTNEFRVDPRSLTIISTCQLLDDLSPKLSPYAVLDEAFTTLYYVNPHVYGFKHKLQYEDEANIKESLEGLPCPINTRKLRKKDIKEIFEECSKVFDSYDTLGEWNNDADQEWWAVLEKEALAHGCTYYEDED